MFESSPPLIVFESLSNICLFHLPFSSALSADKIPFRGRPRGGAPYKDARSAGSPFLFADRTDCLVFALRFGIGGGSIELLQLLDMRPVGDGGERQDCIGDHVVG